MLNSLNVIKKEIILKKIFQIYEIKLNKLKLYYYQTENYCTSVNGPFPIPIVESGRLHSKMPSSTVRRMNFLKN